MNKPSDMSLWQMEDALNAPRQPEPEDLLHFYNPVEDGGYPIGSGAGYGGEAVGGDDGAGLATDEGYGEQGASGDPATELAGEEDVEGMRDALESRAIQEQEANQAFQKKVVGVKL